MVIGALQCYDARGAMSKITGNLPTGPEIAPGLGRILTVGYNWLKALCTEVAQTF
jgi:hypothetical protein